MYGYQVSSGTSGHYPVGPAGPGMAVINNNGATCATTPSTVRAAAPLQHNHMVGVAPATGNSWQQQPRFHMQQQVVGNGTVVMGVPYHQGALLRSALSNTMPSPPPTPPAVVHVQNSAYQQQYMHHHHHQHQHLPAAVVHAGTNPAAAVMYNSQARLQHYRNMQQQQRVTVGDGVVPAHARPSPPPPYDLHCKALPPQHRPMAPVAMVSAAAVAHNIAINNNSMKPPPTAVAVAATSGVADGKPVSDTVMMSPTSLCSTPNDIDERLLDSCDKMSTGSSSSSSGGGSIGEDEEGVLEYWTHLALELGVHLLKELPQLDPPDVEWMWGGGGGTAGGGST